MTPRRPTFTARHEGAWTYWDCDLCKAEVTKQLRRNPKDTNAPKAKSAHQCPEEEKAA